MPKHKTGDALLDDILIGCNFDLKKHKNDAVKIGLIKPDKETPKFDEKSSPELIRKKLKIYVTGNDVPKPVSCFPGYIKKYKIPTPVQSQAIPVLKSLRNALICAPTGSGKTAAFLIPTFDNLMNQKVKCALIVQPTVELADQTLKELESINPDTDKIRAFHLANISEKSRRILTKKSPNIIITTPNKLIHFINSDDDEIRTIFEAVIGRTDFLIVDESDKLFDDKNYGKEELSFRNQLGEIFSSLQKNKNRVTYTFFSATYMSDVERWCESYLEDIICITVGTKNTANAAVDQKLVFTNDEQAKLLALRQIFANNFKPPCLIFVQSKDRAKQLYEEIKFEPYRVCLVQGDIHSNTRQEIVSKFRKGEFWVMICTELMGRGLDFPELSLVINYDFPNSAIEYIHRIGRTGRAGKKGKAITLFTPEDTELLRTIGGVIKQAGCDVPDYIMKMKKLNTKNRKKATKNPKRQSIRPPKRKKPEPESNKSSKKPKQD